MPDRKYSHSSFFPQDKLDSSTEPDPDTDDPEDDVDHHLSNQTPTHYEALDDVGKASADLSTTVEEDSALPTDSDTATHNSDARSIQADTQIDDSDVGAADSDAQTGDSDESWAVYDQQVRETALLDMADLAVRSYTSAFLAALALFGVFSFTAFVGAHFYPLPSVADVTDDVVEGDAGVADGEGAEAYAGPPEVTTPMFLRQGVRSEVPALVSPVSASAGSPFGRYQAFVRHMIGQVRFECRLLCFDLLQWGRMEVKALVRERGIAVRTLSGVCSPYDCFIVFLFLRTIFLPFASVGIWWMLNGHTAFFLI
jgi:hypothetical protein